MRILIVEDEPKLAEALNIGLSRKGFAADVVENGEKAFNRQNGFKSYGL